MAGAYVKEVRAEEVLFALVAYLHLRDGNEFLIFTDVVRETFVAKRIDFASDDKAICPNLY